MESVLSFKAGKNGTATITFGYDFIKVQIFGKYPEECYIRHSSVKNFRVKEYSTFSMVIFDGEDFEFVSPKKSKIETHYSFCVDNDDGQLNLTRIFEDRTPFQTLKSKMEDTITAYNYKKQSANKQKFGNIYIKVSKIKAFDVVIDGVEKISFYNLQYVNGYRVLTLPVEKWTVHICGGNNEDGNAFTTNALTFDFTTEPLNQYTEIKYNWIKGPDFIKEIK